MFIVEINSPKTALGGENWGEPGRILPFFDNLVLVGGPVRVQVVAQFERFGLEDGDFIDGLSQLADCAH